MSMQIKLFGNMEVKVNGASIAEWRSNSTRWLFAILALRCDRPVDRSWLSALLWPNSSEHQALANLRFNLSKLRNCLGSERDRIAQTEGSSLIMDLSNSYCDVRYFDMLSNSSSINDLYTAAELYSEALLPSCDLYWIREERDVRRDKLLGCLLTLAKYYVKNRNSETALRHLQRAHSIDPFSSEIASLIMQCFLNLNKRSESILFFRNFRLNYLQELRSEPDQELKELYECAKQNSRTQLTQKVNLSKECCSDENVPVGLIRKLPYSIFELYGRDIDLTKLPEKVLSNRLVSLTGSGGIGKTCLAIALGKILIEKYSKLVCFVELSALVPDADVLPVILAALGFYYSPEIDVDQIFVELLDNMNIILILDNCEHVIASASKTVKKLLELSSTIRIVVTSRRTLGLVEECNWKVQSLSLPSEGETSVERKLTESAALQLFENRARKADHSFLLDEHNSEEVLRICKLLDANPLGIEMAASRIGYQPLKLIEAQIKENCLESLLLHDFTLPSRHRSLHAVIDWSYRLLNDEEQRVLMFLSLFPAGCMLPQLALATPIPGLSSAELNTVLSQLAEWSLLKCEENETFYRYRLLEPVRQFASEMLQSSDYKEYIYLKWWNYLEAVASAAVDNMDGFDQLKWLNILEIEQSNFMFLFASLYSDTLSDEEIQRMAEIAVRLTQFWEIRGLASVGLRIQQCLLHSFLPALTNEIIIDLSLAAAKLSITLGTYRESDELLKSVENILNKSPNGKQLAMFNAISALQDDMSMEYKREHAVKALEYYKRNQDCISTAKVLSILAQIEVRSGNYNEAEKDIEHALNIISGSGAFQTEARLLTIKGNLLWGNGEYHRSINVYYTNALKINSELKNYKEMAICLLNVGGASCDMGEYSSSRRAYLEAESILRRIERTTTAVYVRECAGCSLIFEGQWDKAKELFDSCLSEARELRDEILEAEILADMCLLTMHCQNELTSSNYYKELHDIHNDEIQWQLFRGDCATLSFNLDSKKYQQTVNLTHQIFHAYPVYLDFPALLELNVILSIALKNQGRMQDLRQVLTQLMLMEWKLPYPKVGFFTNHFLRIAELMLGLADIEDVAFIVQAGNRLRKLSDIGTPYYTRMAEEKLLEQITAQSKNDLISNRWSTGFDLDTLSIGEIVELGKTAVAELLESLKCNGL